MEPLVARKEENPSALDTIIVPAPPSFSEEGTAAVTDAAAPVAKRGKERTAHIC